MMNGIGNSLSGIQRNMNIINKNARRTARIGIGNDPKGFTKRMIDDKLAQRSIEADIKTIKTQDEMMGSLLDIMG